jgi:alcohol dehydrogenase
MSIVTYAHKPPTLFGEGAVNQVGEKVKEFGCTKVMIVTDEGVNKAGLVAIVQKSLKESGIDSIVYDKVNPDPVDTVVNNGGEIARSEKVDGVIGLGGGSSMDAAKAIAIVAINEPPISRYYLNTNYGKTLPKILIPTTSGTGSENTIYGVITDSESHAKKVTLLPGDLAICDPELTYGLPAEITANTGMDAFAHAAESLTANISSPLTELMAPQAIRWITKYLPTAVTDPKNVEARRYMMLASNYAGSAFNNTMCHLGHALSQCMGAAFHTAHGITCAWALPETISIVSEVKTKEVKIIADALGVEYDDKTAPGELGKKVADTMRAFMRKMNIKGFTDYGLTKDQLVGIADMVLADNCFPYIPIELNKKDVEAFLARVYDAYK